MEDWNLSDEQQEQILIQRAQELSGSSENTRPDQEETLSVVSFLLAKETYAIEIRYLLETIQLKELAKVPGVPPYIVGISNLRGTLFPVIDLKRMFNMPGKGLTAEIKIIILHAENTILGILTDGIHGNSEIHPLDAKPLPVSLQMPGMEYIKGMTENGLILLDGEKLIYTGKMNLK